MKKRKVWIVGYAVARPFIRERRTVKSWGMRHTVAKYEHTLDKVRSMR